MSKQFDISAEPRSLQGRGASRRLRSEGKVPAIVYGGHDEPRMLMLSHDELQRQLEHEGFYSQIINLKVGDDSEQVVLKDLQRHPAKPFILHADFRRIVAGEKFRTHVPLHFLGEKEAPGVKDEGGVVQHLMVEVEIECLPANLPEYIEVDVSTLELHDSLHLSDLTLPADVELVDLMHDNDRTVISIQIPRIEVEPEPEEEEPLEGEELEAAEGEEGEERAEGEQTERKEGEQVDSEEQEDKD